MQHLLLEEIRVGMLWLKWSKLQSDPAVHKGSFMTKRKSANVPKGSLINHNGQLGVPKDKYLLPGSINATCLF